MFLDTVRRRKLARDAARYLDENEAAWVSGYWLIELDENGIADEANDYLDGTSKTMGSIREWLRGHGFGSQNRKCGVCAEGALLLALAADPLVEDDVIAESLIREFNEDAARASLDLGFIEDYEDFDSIPELNDSQFESGQAAELLRVMGNL